ncbi:MAG: Holliday junction branch migration protein RuvA [Bacteroidetes bacterium]|nr:Holliday junction branch migration protein RuvA [Bacteroidota bacterium]
MYEFIKGRLTEKTPTYAVIEANGIGYLLHISLNTYSQLEEDSHCCLLVHLVVREDAMILFGFSGADERELFRQLISVSGIGPNTARMILSSVQPSEIIQAIAQGNAPLLQSIKGIGSKTAQRLIVELKDKLSKDLIPYEKLPGGHNTKKEEALSGLIILGFSKMIAEKALTKVIEKEGSALPVEQLIRHALKIL